VSALAFSVFTLLNAASYLALSWSTNGVPYVTPGVRMKSVDGTMALLALSVICMLLLDTPFSFVLFLCFCFFVFCFLFLFVSPPLVFFISLSF